MGRFREPSFPRKIGAGQFGNVFECLDTETGRLIAVKKLCILNDRPRSPSPSSEGEDRSGGSLNEKMVLSILSEISLMKKIVHPNVVQYIGATRTPSELRIYMEYVAGGSLASMIDKYCALPENIVRVYMADVVQGLRYLHERRIAHRDIKCENLLVCSSGVVKLADFGCSKELTAESEDGLANTVAGTPLYMAPEVARKLGPYDPFAADVWTLGITGIQLLTGHPPFREFKRSPLKYLLHIAREGVLPEIPQPPAVSPEAADFLHQCIVRDPAKRATIAALDQHPFVVQGKMTPSDPYGSDGARVPGGVSGGIPVFSPTTNTTSPSSP